ncbi:MAG: 6-carboxytetrahydropterin synthase [Gammaproteobacteria bacterium]|nr:6-carboxytetrahydropterin synthase [Gammaproteobacteria bacterium]
MRGRFHTAHRQMAHPGKCRFPHGHTWRAEFKLVCEALSPGRTRYGDRLRRAEGHHEVPGSPKIIVTRNDPDFLDPARFDPEGVVVIDGRGPSVENVAYYCLHRILDVIRGQYPDHGVTYQIEVTIQENGQQLLHHRGDSHRVAGWSSTAIDRSSFGTRRRTDRGVFQRRCSHCHSSGRCRIWADKTSFSRCTAVRRSASSSPVSGSSSGAWISTVSRPLASRVTKQGSTAAPVCCAIRIGPTAVAAGRPRKSAITPPVFTAWSASKPTSPPSRSTFHRLTPGRLCGSPARGDGCGCG